MTFERGKNGKVSRRQILQRKVPEFNNAVEIRGLLIGCKNIVTNPGTRSLKYYDVKFKLRFLTTITVFARISAAVTNKNVIKRRPRINAAFILINAAFNRTILN